MATNRILTLTVGGKVIIKVIAGSVGPDAAAFVTYARETYTQQFLPSLHEIYAAATSYGFGEADNLVVMNGLEVYHRTGEELGPLYREKFSEPRFNPRFNVEMADHIDVIEL